MARNGTTETVTSQDMSTQGTSAQGTSAQDTSTQGTSAQGTSAQGTSVQGMPSQIQNVFTPRRLELLTENSPSGRSMSSSSSVQTGIKLPKISLARFSGDITKYQSFWQCFRSAVHENTTISTVQKFTYLMCSLEGTAYRALEGFDLTEENYEQAIDTLKSRFGKSQQIISAHMQEILKLNTNPNETVTQLRTILDKINVHVRGLEALGITSERYGSLLIPLIMSRMPTEITLQVTRKVEEDQWKIAEILEIM